MSFIGELKRRNVIRVAIAYAIVAWLLIEVTATTFPLLRLPEWTATFVIVMVMIGFPVALILAWAYEVTPDGVKRAPDAGAAVPAVWKGRALNYLIIVALAAAIAWLLVERSQVPSEVSETTKSIAVVPFNDLSSEGNQAWFADGLAEEILNSLARLPELKVVSRTSSFHFRNQEISLREIASQLDVEHILEGSVRRSGDQLRVTAQLIRAADDSRIWSATYNASSDDVFRVQEDVAENVAGALDVFLDDKKREAMFAVGTRNVQAYEYYLQGVKLYHQWHNQDEFGRTDRIWRANTWFDRALEADPEFALVYYLRTNAFAHFLADENDVGAPPGLTYAEALMAIRADFGRAVELAEDPAQKLIFQIHQNFFSDDWSRLPLLVDQIDFDGVQYTRLSSFQNLPPILVVLGRGRDAFALADDARQRNPFDTTPWTDAITALRSMGDSEKALEYVRRAETQFSRSLGYFKFPILMEVGRPDEAAALIIQTDDNSLFLQSFHALVLAGAGRRAEAQQIIETLVAQNYEAPFLVSVLLAAGDRQAAESLVRSIDARPGGVQFLASTISFTYGGKLFFDLAWAPNLAARSADAAIEFERWAGSP